MNQERIKKLTMSALMIALIFVFTYTIKVPNVATGGYSHMGDCMIFLSVIMLGKKQGALAGGLGAALSDMLSGAVLWILPTFIIKLIMGWMMGSILEKQISGKYTWVIAAIFSGLWQCLAYTIVKIPLFNVAVAFASIPGIVAQTGTGLIIYCVIAKALEKYNLINLKGALVLCEK